MHVLIKFLTSKMSMTDLYQPAIIRELLISGGTQSKEQLAKLLAQYDVSVIDYYKKIVMRWPKTTLVKHGVVDYDKKSRRFSLRDFPQDEDIRDEAVKICDQKIAEWIEKKAKREGSPETSASLRYQVLKASGGKCQLCGIPSSLRPIDVDHIIPSSKANKQEKVLKDGKWIHKDSRENLQALCFACNRAKRNEDETDFRRIKKLVRDRIPEIIRSEGRKPCVKELSGASLTTALYEKLIEEHAEFIAAKDTKKKLSELADMVEVVLAVARHHGTSEAELMNIVCQKRESRGGFEKGYFYVGDE